MGATFPENFTWGAATASYQIEGGANEDGRGESIWDRFSHSPGSVANGDTGDVACDHFHRWKDDVALMSELNLNAYRFSVAWPRVIPEGWGQVNASGLDFYDRLVDELLASGIEPWITLYHWDLPQRLDDAGGWLHRSVADAFADYADVVTRRLGDRVKRWITINEPWVISMVGYMEGRHAPGHTSWSEALQAAHNVLLAHGSAVPAIRSNSNRSTAGIVLNLTTVRPGSDEAADGEAAMRYDGWYNRWWLDALSGKGYPDDTLELLSDMLPEVAASDMATISTRTDFLGINYYSPAYVVEDVGANPLDASRVVRAGAETTAMGWEIEPKAFTELLVRVHNEYEFSPLYVTENGAAIDDPAPENWTVSDPRRSRYIHDHLEALLEARSQGAAVEGYFCWSLMDNFEWAYGYGKRFGIVHVDYETQERTIKESGRWYAGIAEANELLDPDG